MLWFEKIGNSSLLADYLLPVGCTTVFFPGCALPGIRPRETYLLFRLLQKKVPQLGMVFDCCNKPSHDLGFQENFSQKFKKKVRKLQDKGVKKIITACPSCLQIFRRYGGGNFVSEIIYTYFEHGVTRGKFNLSYTLHDPCTLRFDPEIHQAVRRLTGSMGVPLTEMAHNRATTFCCGEGGTALDPDGGRERGWRDQRLAEAGNQSLLTYCAGCTSALASGKTYHLLDLLLAMPGRQEKPPKTVSPPLTYLNRLYLKCKVKIILFLQRRRKL